jgi:hypothetical protein
VASDFTNRTLRTWAWIAGVHGLTIALTMILLVPWKTGWVNAACVAYAMLQGAVAFGLWRRTLWGWRLGLISGLIGLASGVLIIMGLLLSWVYLRGIYGAVGYGAAVLSLLGAAVVFEVLGLVPAMQLRALLRREVRGDFRPAKAVQQAIILLLLVPLVSVLLVAGHAQYTPVTMVAAEGQGQSIAVLRAALQGSARPAAPALVGVPLGPGPLYVSLWQSGELMARVRGDGADLAAAVDHAASALRTHAALHGYDSTLARLKVDRVRAVHTLRTESPLLVALSVVPGQDGLRRRDGTAEQVLLPDDMIRADRFGAITPLPALPDMRLGLDTHWALARLKGPLGALERLILESWVESVHGTLPVLHGNTPLAPATPEDFAHAARQAGDFIVRQQHADGQFHYIYSALDHRHAGTSRRSLARHAGAIYSLAQLYAHTYEPRFAHSAAQAARWVLDRYSRPCGMGRRCLVQGRYAKLGESALTLIALLEYQRATQQEEFGLIAREFGAFVLAMQRGDGEFHQVSDLWQQTPAPQHRWLFASEQAALALVMTYNVFADRRFLQGAERALDFLTGPKYASFVGWFSYGEDHWTCIAAQEAWPHLTSPRYVDFCRGYAAYLRRLQYAATHPVFAGHYGVSSVLVPQAAATAGYTEAMISTYKLSVHHGQADAVLKAQVRAALETLRRDQLREDNSYLATSPLDASGGVRRSIIQQDIRLDFTQHALSALIRGAAL